MRLNIRKIKIGLIILGLTAVAGLVVGIVFGLPILANYNIKAVEAEERVIIMYKTEVDEKDIEELEAMGSQIKYVYDIIPGIAAVVSKQDIADLERDEDVAYVVADEVYSIMLRDSARQIGANRVWTAVPGATGVNTRVCITDTGIDATHPALPAPIVWRDFLAGRPGPYDDHGHGTHVAGIVASRDAVDRGISPGASLLIAKVCDAGGRCWASDIIAGIDWCVANTARIISISLGGGAYDKTCDLVPTTRAANSAVDRGVVVVAASGNNGWPEHISAPACGSNVIAVGAVNKLGGRTSFSNEGEILDLVAPGVNISSTRAGGGFIQMTGTSMATPHVAGTAALILQANSLLRPAEVRTILRDTAKDLEESGGFNTIFGHGRVDAWAAYQRTLFPIAPLTREADEKE